MAVDQKGANEARGFSTRGLTELGTERSRVNGKKISCWAISEMEVATKDLQDSKMSKLAILLVRLSNRKFPTSSRLHLLTACLTAELVLIRREMKSARRFHLPLLTDAHHLLFGYNYKLPPTLLHVYATHSGGPL